MTVDHNGLTQQYDIVKMGINLKINKSLETFTRGWKLETNV